MQISAENGELDGDHRRQVNDCCEGKIVYCTIVGTLLLGLHVGGGDLDLDGALGATINLDRSCNPTEQRRNSLGASILHG
jgi:hypothetical protein